MSHNLDHQHRDMAQYGGTATSSPSVSQLGQQGPAPQHKRVYQACIPCRRRKVRCDLGSVDNPNDPPCVRCRRESKECFFSATRRKRKTDDGEGSDADDYTVRNGRKRPFPNEDTPPQIERQRLYSDTPLTPGGSQGRSQPLRRPDSNGEERGMTGKRPRRDGEYGHDGDDNAQMENPDAQTVMRQGVYGPHDALDLLYKAATDTDRLVDTALSHSPQHADTRSPMTITRHQRAESRTSIATIQMPPRPTVEDQIDQGQPRSQVTPGRMEQPIDPELGKQDWTSQPGYAEAIKAWQRFRFVRAGWFTPQEAIEYLD